MKRFCIAAVLAAAMCVPATGHAQGCSLCRDTAAGSAKKAREGLRRGILVLGVPAGAVFAGILVVAWKIKPLNEDRS